MKVDSEAERNPAAVVRSSSTGQTMIHPHDARRRRGAQPRRLHPMHALAALLEPAHELSPIAQHIGWVLVMRTDNVSGEASIEQRALARLTGWSVRPVIHALQELEERGMLESVRTLYTNRYRWTDKVCAFRRAPESGKHAICLTDAEGLEIDGVEPESGVTGNPIRSRELAPLALPQAAEPLALVVDAIDLAEELVEAHAAARQQVRSVHLPSSLPEGRELERLFALVRLLVAETDRSPTDVCYAMMLAYVSLETDFLRERKWPLTTIGRDLENVEIGARQRLRRSRPELEQSEAERLREDFERDREKRQAAARLRYARGAA